MVQKSQTTTWDGAKTLQIMGFQLPFTQLVSRISINSRDDNKIMIQESLVTNQDSPIKSTCSPTNLPYKIKQMELQALWMAL